MRLGFPFLCVERALDCRTRAVRHPSAVPGCNARTFRPTRGCNIQKAEKTRFVKLVRQVGFINIASQLMGYTRNAFRYHMEQDEVSLACLATT